MANNVTLGGNRLGSGKKMKVSLHAYERSTHDLGYLWRSSMSSGTLVPYMSIVGLPGDTFDIELNADVKTYPTIGPLFGSYKLQLDVFMCPIRLYQGQLHNNKLNIGNNMSKIKLPRLEIESKGINFVDSLISIENQQINQSSLLAYLGIRGLGNNRQEEAGANVMRRFNAIPYLSYWDIYKNYYANKQEEIGMVIHNEDITNLNWIYMRQIRNGNIEDESYYPNIMPVDWYDGDVLTIRAPKGAFDNNNCLLTFSGFGTKPILEWGSGSISTTGDISTCNVLLSEVSDAGVAMTNIQFTISQKISEKISLNDFPLDNIDKMREDILSIANNDSALFTISSASVEPYNLPLKTLSNGYPAAQGSQSGLGIKTYQSDIFNNWLSSEWIDGDNGINKITAISTQGDSFTLDTLNLSKKVYDMLNRIAISGGSYDDWVMAVYDQEPYGRAESPVYLGGLSKEVVFQEVVSNAASEVNGEVNELGSLAGRGMLAQKHKGGKVVVKCSEPCYIIGIVSLTPRVDYSQGNNWDVNLKTMDDFHKPALDEIGFQELVTDKMAFWDTQLDDDGIMVFNSAGKQPAWLDYMTNYNKCYGNFADSNKEMYMTLNRRYEHDSMGRITDLTTYIDPTKFNNIFAQTSLDAQNFWVQIAVDCTARRKMSAKVMPNL